MIEEVNAGVPQPDFISIAEQNRNKQANFIYTRYLKDPDNSVECKIIFLFIPTFDSEAKTEIEHGFPCFSEG